MRMYKYLQEMSKIMLNKSKVVKYFLEEEINTTCYVQNRISIKPILNKTLYEF